jgi:hypothetical protein
MKQREGRFDSQNGAMGAFMELVAACLPKPRRRQVIRRSLEGVDYGE